MPLEANDIASIAQALKDLGAPAQQGINAFSLKLPEFWTDKPEVWLAREEAQFGTKNINQDQTKFVYVVSSLDNTTAGVVQAILMDPPAANKYNALKAPLLAAFGKRQVQKDSELLSIAGLGDMKPTALLHRLQSLNSDPAMLFRAHLLALLPSEVRSVLAGREIPDIADLAKAADRVMEAKGFDTHQVAAVASQWKPASQFQNPRRTPTRQGGGGTSKDTKRAPMCVTTTFDTARMPSAASPGAY